MLTFDILYIFSTRAFTALLIPLERLLELALALNFNQYFLYSAILLFEGAVFLLKI